MKLLDKKKHKYKTIISYCLKCKKNTESINPNVSKTNNNKTMRLSKCFISDTEKSRFIKKEEANTLLTSLGIKTPLSKTPLLGNALF